MPGVALTQQGDPTDPSSWSGVPARLANGFEEIGCEVVPVSAEPRGADRLARLFRMSWAHQSTNRAFAAAASLKVSLGLKRAGRLDGVAMLGSGYLLHTALPFVTFDDMTVTQALRRSDPPLNSIGEAAGARWIARQQRIYDRSRGCCVCSSWAADSVRDEYGIDPAKIHVVGVGRNIDPKPTTRDWSLPRFLFVGADWERKRGSAVVSAFADVRKRHPGATLDLVGRHPRVDADGVTGHGVLPLDSDEGQRRYSELLRRATCFLMPSTHEPFGIAYVDAGAAGVPSIGTTSGGAADAVGDGGRVVDPADDPALVAAMLELADPDTAHELGERARAHSALLTWRAVAERLLRALRPPGVDIDSLSEFLAPPGRDGAPA
jgi:glycosyltransferase involved in cell wall biosynthesis